MAQQAPESRSKAAERLKSEASGLVGALGDRALASVRERLEGTAGRLTQYVEGGAGPGLIAAVTGARNLAEGKSPARSLLGAGTSFMKEKVAGMFGRRGKGGQRKLKLTDIVESIDVGVPISLAYNQWTQYSDFPKFTKKVENVDQDQADETKTNWKAQIFWSHRTWEATVIDQVPDDRIVWRSKGQKGHVDGAVTFHELAPNLTRIMLVMEYHPQGLFEHTGNLWRAQGRRARLEFKHFRRHMMTEGILHPDELEGWRGTIHDGEVVESHEDAVAREEEESRQAANGQAGARARGREDRGEDREDQEERPEDQEELTAGREQERGEQEEEEGRGEEDRDRRAAEARPRASRSRRSAPVGRTNRGTERRSRAGAATRRGGSR